ncbi:50S ribosomal protein L24 [Candidatus Peregrinibacteria bacterium]|nr:MAG: 50S ribosomal protein L24 [Candidatus Peregrinibacteria bacterium]
MKFRILDLVKVIAGRDKGKTGVILKICQSKGTLIVEGVNMVTKHLKPKDGQPGQKVEVEASIAVSNVMYFSKKSNEVTRIKYSVGKDKQRVEVRSGEVITANTKRK